MTQESDALDVQQQNSSVKEHEIVVVSALIEEKARLAEAKVQLKKSCKEEKARLEEQLAKMQERKEKIEEEESAAILRQIEAEYE